MLLVYPRLKVKVCVRLGVKQRGVYCLEAIEEGQTVEVSPAMVFNKKESKIVDATKLGRYVFEWGDDRKRSAVGLGYVSMYNHSTEPNVDYAQDFDEEDFTITALRDIAKGEELTFNYNGEVDDKTPQWFEEPAGV
ncbi:MAG: SET domain-containing protein-lysine N-methyltransferase [Nitrosomonadaceae bacterium]